MDYLELDITKKQPLTNRIYLRQGDGGIQKMGIQILKDGQPYSVTGYSLKFEGNLSDGKMVQGNATAEDASQGKFIYTFRNADSSVAGDMRNAYFRLYDTTGNALASRRLLVTVEKNADVTAGQAQDYISGVDDLVNETTEKLADNNQSIANQATQIADLQEALYDVSLHQAWATGEDGEGFSQSFGENYVLNSETGKEVKANSNWLPKYSFISEALLNVNNTFEIGCDLVNVGNDIPEGTSVDIEVWIQIIGDGLDTANILKKNIPIKLGEAKHVSNVINLKLNNYILGSASMSIRLAGFTDGRFRLDKMYLKKHSGLSEIWSPAPIDDPINCYPKYVGFGIKNSDNYQDYRWILNPEWAMANAIYGTQVTTLKEQLNKLQDLQEG